jgi:O-antigen ligase
MAINVIKDHPLFGIGPGAYKYEMFNYFPYMLDDWWGRLFIYYHEVTEGANFSHNFFLVFFSDMGVLGLLTAIFLPIIYFKIGIETMKKYKSGHAENYYLIVVLFAAGTSIIARNFFNSIGILFYGGVTTDLPFWLIFSSLIYFYMNATNKDYSLKNSESFVTNNLLNNEV